MSKNKKEKKKPSHGVLSDMGYIIGVMGREYNVSLWINLLWTLLLPVSWTLSPFFNKYVMDAIAYPERRLYSICVLAGLLLLQILSFSITMMCNRYMNAYGYTKFHWLFIRKIVRKRMTMDYQNTELTSSGDSYQKAWQGFNTITNALNMMRNTFANAVQVTVYTIVLARLSPLMILVSGFPSLLCFLINRRVDGWKWRNTDKWTNLDRQLGYVASASSDFAYAKDTRLYNMSGWLSRKFQSIWEKRLFWYKKYDGNMTRWKIVMNVIFAASTLASYGITIYMIMKGGIGAGDFVMYFTSISDYGNAVWNLSSNLSGFFWLRDNINFYRDYLDMPDKFNHGKGAALPLGQCELELKNVSYTYPNAEKPTINNISFKLHKGERLALVGLNGAGKSTLIKLMCGLYDPAEGEILLNGTDVRKFNREEYYSLFSTVFQDFDILPVTISQNITQSEDSAYDSAAVEDVLKKSGLYDKVETLPQKKHTLLAKSVFDDATDFSGGEMQKLALAKALYKDSPLLLLDEPTAALDPISEQEMYLRYAEFSKDKASVFISHRLASTRFCDNIILIENGSIAEQGTHTELMEKGGKYAELFGIQSAYYRDNEEEEEL